MIISQYICTFTIVYLIKKNTLNLNQLQMAKLSLRILLNHLNEALFMRSDDGRLSYCNNLGAKIIKKSSQNCFSSEKQQSDYC